jgi:hypothetical protein
MSELKQKLDSEIEARCALRQASEAERAKDQKAADLLATGLRTKISQLTTELEENKSLQEEIGNSCVEARMILGKTSQKLLVAERELERERSERLRLQKENANLCKKAADNPKTCEMAEKEETIACLRIESEEKTQKIARLLGELTDLAKSKEVETSETLARFFDSETEKTKILERAETDAAHYSETISLVRAELTEKEEALDQALSTVGEKEEALIRACTELAEKDRILTGVTEETSSLRIELQTAAAKLSLHDRTNDEVVALREQAKELDAIKIDLEITCGEAKELRVKIQAAQAKLAEIDRVVEENRELRITNSELEEHRDSTPELERLRAEHKQLRIEADLLQRRMDTLDAKEAELIDLRSKVHELSIVASEVEDLRNREMSLQARLFAGGRQTPSPRIPRESQLPDGTPILQNDMECSLDSLMREKSARSAVLADGNGFVIANAGDSAAEEGLAAFTGLVGEMTKRARAFLPLGVLDSLKIFDSNGIAISCRFFDSAGTSYALATVNNQEPEHSSSEDGFVDLVRSFADRKSFVNDYSSEHSATSASG